MLRRSALLAIGSTSLLSPVCAADLRALVAAIKPSVCPVGTQAPLDSPRFTFRGSGFAIGNGSLIATCWHVVRETAAAERTGLKTPAVLVPGEGGAYSLREAELVASDPARDLALLRIQGRSVAPLAIEAEAAAAEGTEVALMGFPIGGALGYRHVTHRGVISAIVSSDLPAANARQLQQGAASRLREGQFEMLQLDATAYPGNSGGPLIDVEHRKVVGIVNMVLLKGNRESALSQPTGITYAVPARHLAALLGRV